VVLNTIRERLKKREEEFRYSEGKVTDYIITLGMEIDQQNRAKPGEKNDGV